MNPHYRPASILPEYAKTKSAAPTNEDPEQANKEKAQKLPEDKAARRAESSRTGSASVMRKQMASTEEPRDTTKERREREC